MFSSAVQLTHPALITHSRIRSIQDWRFLSLPPSKVPLECYSSRPWRNLPSSAQHPVTTLDPSTTKFVTRPAACYSVGQFSTPALKFISVYYNLEFSSTLLHNQVVYAVELARERQKQPTNQVEMSAKSLLGTCLWVHGLWLHESRRSM